MYTDCFVQPREGESLYVDADTITKLDALIQETPDYTVVSISGAKVDFSTIISFLKSSTHLNYLDLYHCKISNLERVEDLKQLTHLSLKNCSFHGESNTVCLAELSALKYLEFGESEIDCFKGPIGAALEIFCVSSLKKELPKFILDESAAVRALQMSAETFWSFTKSKVRFNNLSVLDVYRSYDSELNLNEVDLSEGCDVLDHSQMFPSLKYCHISGYMFNRIPQCFISESLEEFHISTYTESVINVDNLAKLTSLKKAQIDASLTMNASLEGLSDLRECTLGAYNYSELVLGDKCKFPDGLVELHLRGSLENSFADFGGMKALEVFSMLEPKSSIPELLDSVKTLKLIEILYSDDVEIPRWILTIEGLQKLTFSSKLARLSDEVKQLKNLKCLDVSGNQLSELPETLDQLEHLEELHFHDNPIVKLPETIFDTPWNEQHNGSDNRLSHKGLKALPNNISKLSQKSETLTLECNQLRTLPESISDLTWIREIDLSENQFECFPESVSRMYGLWTIKLSKNKMTKLAENLDEIPNLESLDLSENSINDFKVREGRLTSLKQLNLSDNNIVDLPDDLGRLQGLRDLTLKGNSIRSFPESVRNLENITDLDLSHLGLSCLPINIELFPNLKRLNLSGNNITKLPSRISECAQLEYLNLSENKLSEFPDALFGLTNLRWLNINCNKILKVGSGVLQLTNLRYLSLKGCDIDELCEELINLENLKELDVSWNNIHQLPLERSGNALRVLNLEENKLNGLIPNWVFQSESLYLEKEVMTRCGRVIKNGVALPAIEELLHPISEDSTAGIDIFENITPLGYLSQVQLEKSRLKELEREHLANLCHTNEDNSGIRQECLDRIIKLCKSILREESKDLRVMLWYVDATIERYGIEGVDHSFTALNAFFENFWNDCYPDLSEEGGDLRYTWLETYLSRSQSIIEKQIHLTSLTGENTSTQFNLWDVESLWAKNSENKDKSLNTLVLENVPEAFKFMAEDWAESSSTFAASALRSLEEIELFFSTDGRDEYFVKLQAIKDKLTTYRDLVSTLVSESSNGTAGKAEPEAI